jgi:hypothetical protein
MPKIVFLAILLVIAGAYVALFTTWNMTPVSVVGYQWGGDIYWQKLPTAYLPLLGVAIGVLVMCIACLANWVGMRSRLKHVAAQVAKAKVVIDQQRKRLAELEGSLADLRKPKPADEAAVAPTAGAAEPAPDDEEII